MKRFGRLVVASTAVSIAASLVVTRWQRRWGATQEEVAGALPGDASVAEPASEVTRAVAIAAPPQDVWPWLVQIGADRAGFYSYDRLEDLFGLGIHSADTIVADWQRLEVGDVVYATRRRTGGWYVQEIRPDQALVLQIADLGSGRTVRRDDRLGWEFSWAFVLRPTRYGGTRLLVRERVAFGSLRMRLLMAPLGAVSFVMTRRMLLGIKERAERHGRGAGPGA